MSSSLGTRQADLAAAAVVAVCLAAVLLLAGDYGLSWDEPIQNDYGLLASRFFRSGGEDVTFLELDNLRFYGAWFDLMVVELAAVLPWPDHHVRHLLTGLFAVLGVAGAWRLGRCLGGPWAGLIAAMMLALTPSWVGHGFMNPKDIPFAAVFVWALHLLLRGEAALPRPHWGLTVGFGVVLGLALGVRVAAGVLALAAVLAVLVRPRRDWPRAILTWLLPAGAVSFATWIAFWPWGHLDPLLHPIRAVLEFGRFPWPYHILFNGEYVLGTEVPPGYLPLHLAVKLPPLILLLLLVGIGVALIRTIGSGPHPAQPIARRFGLVLLVLALPPLAAIAAGSTIYDEIRHFLFLLPPFCALAATVLVTLWRGAAGWGRWLLASLAMAQAVALIVTMVRLHPYQYAYHNLLAGGLRGADGRFELDYWGLSLREAVERLKAEVGNSGGPVRVGLYGPDPRVLQPFAGPELEIRPWWDETVEYYVIVDRWGWGADDGRFGKEVLVVERLGVRLARVTRAPGGGPPVTP